MTRVGIDVSPLVQTQAGTARYLRASTGGRRRARRLAFAAAGARPRVSATLVWYPLGLPHRRGASARRPPLPDLPRPRAHRCPLVVTVHDLAVLRHPETFNRWTRRYSRLASPGWCGRQGA